MSMMIHFYFLCYAALLQRSIADLPLGFVYLHDIAPDIQVSLRYASEENFIGRVVNGYKANVSIMTEAAALSLKRAQTLAKNDGFELVIYDSYRPQKSVDQFVVWSQNASDQIKKQSYYPRVIKLDEFDLGFTANQSGHTRGSTIDLTLIKSGKKVIHPIQYVNRTLTDNYIIWLLDDGTVDMGSSFDLSDEASYTNSTLVNDDYRQTRAYLKGIMEMAGFSNYPLEWWHYTLNNETFPDTYFDFDIEETPLKNNGHRQLLNFTVIDLCLIYSILF
ncbi:unnamed protein product [Rotaria sp. Silwood2]|nr:unnamed protein product [Rotaria sp. Silwood2]